jgi:hypothetical protein
MACRTGEEFVQLHISLGKLSNAEPSAGTPIAMASCEKLSISIPELISYGPSMGEDPLLRYGHSQTPDLDSYFYDESSEDLATTPADHE